MARKLTRAVVQLLCLLWACDPVGFGPSRPGAPVKLAFRIQPRDTTAGVAISPVVVVAIQDVSGNTVTNTSWAVAVALGANPGGGTLLGTTTVDAVNGVATFGDLAIRQPGVGYATGDSH